VDNAVINLLKKADKIAVQLIEKNRSKIEKLVIQLEAEETLDIEAIKACLAPDKRKSTLKSQKNLPSTTD